MLRWSLALAALGCRPDAEHPPSGSGDDHRPPSGVPPSPWTVRLEGIGPILYGMAASDARAALGDTLGDPTPADGCLWLVPDGVPPGLRFMVESGKIARVDVDSAGLRTEAGDEVGMSESDLRARYPRAEVRPHKYDTAGRYVIVPDSTEPTRRLVFETDGQRVVRYRGGVVPSVDYVEGCS